jgi:hypothetical protein
MALKGASVVTRDQAAAFIQALHLAQPYVPPVVFAGIASSPVARTLEAVANGLIELEPRTGSSPGGEQSQLARP